MTNEAACLTDRQAFEATRHFLQAYWERGGRKADELAVLLANLEADPAQWNDWLAAVSKVDKRS